MSKLKPCPFCGNEVYVEKRPFWRTTNSGTTHGYYGCYEFDVRCTNPDCGCHVNLGKNDTIYQPEKEALQNAINAWNKRTDNALSAAIQALKAEPIKHGHWIWTGSCQICSICGEEQYGVDTGRYYCPNCGAKMDGEENEYFG